MLHGCTTAWSTCATPVLCSAADEPIFAIRSDTRLTYVTMSSIVLPAPSTIRAPDSTRSTHAPISVLISFATFALRERPHLAREQYVLRDAESGRPLANVRYRIRLSSGKIFTGVTDATGHTQRVTSAYVESLKFEIARSGNAAS